MKNRTGFVVLAALLGLALLLAGCQAGAGQSALSAALSEIQGTVGVKPPESADFRPATGDTVLTERGQVKTGGDGRVRLDLSDGAIFRMAPMSLFELVSNQSTDQGLVTRLSLELGRLFIVLKGGSLDVETPSGVASVRGSYMMVEVDSKTLDVLVTCLEGHCEASNPAGKVQFGTGQKSLLLHRDPTSGQYSAPKVEPMTDEDYQKWLEGSPEARTLAQQGLASLPSIPSPEPSPTPKPAPAPSDTPQPAPTKAAAAPADLGPCMSLVSPPNDLVVDYNDPVVFQWTSKVQAAKYVLTLHYPDGTFLFFETTDTQLTRYFDEMRNAVNFTWDVAALDANGNEMCKSPTGTFTKPAPQPQKTKEPLCAVGQWEDPSAPCYCENAPNQPPYCYADQ